jgi:hypothetical protein
VTPDDEERRPEPPDTPGPPPGEQPPGGAGREWDAAGIDAAFADIVARLQAGDVDTSESGRPGPGGATAGEDPAARPGRRARHARDTDAEGDRGGSQDPAGPASTAETSAGGTSTGDARPGARGRDAAAAGTAPSGATPADGSAGPAEPGSADPAADPAAAEARRRARIEREIDSAVDGPDGGHFVPPEPAPLPRPDAITLLAWIAVIGGPLFLVAGVIVGGLPTWVAGAVVAAVVVGFVLLVARLPRRDETDPDDDGAVV